MSHVVESGRGLVMWVVAQNKKYIGKTETTQVEKTGAPRISKKKS
jgi:hypothetical protein